MEMGFRRKAYAYDVVSQITGLYKYDDRCKVYTDLSS